MRSGVIHRLAPFLVFGCGVDAPMTSADEGSSSDATSTEDSSTGTSEASSEGTTGSGSATTESSGAGTSTSPPGTSGETESTSTSTSEVGTGSSSGATESESSESDETSPETDTESGELTYPPLESFTIAVIGSSTAEGAGASSGQGWVSLLFSALDERVTVDFEGENLAIGGYTTSDLLPGSGQAGNVDDAIDTEPDLLLVALAGSNDLMNGVDEEAYIERLSEIRTAAEAAGIPAFFVGTTPKDLGDEERAALYDWGLAMAETFEPCAIPDAGTEYSPCFIDVFGRLANDSLGIDSDLGSGDGIHLNDEGHAAIFEVAESIVTPYVCRRVPCSSRF